MTIRQRAAELAARIGLGGLAIAILLALLGIQTVRLEGLKIWPVSIEGARPKAERLELALKAVAREQENARKAQQAVNDAKEKEYRDHADQADIRHEASETRVRDAADRYIAANRVRPACDRGAPGGPASPAGSDDPAVPARVSSDPLVAVSDADVRACSAAAGYAVDAHNWAVRLEGLKRTGGPTKETAHR